eukprot:gene2633-3271_t
MINNQDTSIPSLDKAWSISYDELEFGREIGSGGFGKVYKGEYLGAPVAIKKIHIAPDDPNRRDLEKFLRREIETIKLFSHPNVIQFVGCAEHEGVLYIVTELVPGGDLQWYLKNKQVDLPWFLRLNIAHDVSLAMSYLHSKSIVHRDLKSTNLLVGDNWKIKVCDFGFARIVDDSNSKSMTICGTDNWMSPEMITGQDYDERCDIFSFGVLLFELIARMKPTPNMRNGDFSLNRDVVLAQIPDDCPPALLKLTFDCCELDPSNRPSFKEIGKTLKAMKTTLFGPAPVINYPPLRSFHNVPIQNFNTAVAQSPPPTYGLIADAKKIISNRTRSGSFDHHEEEEEEEEEVDSSFPRPASSNEDNSSLQNHLDSDYQSVNDQFINTDDDQSFPRPASTENGLNHQNEAEEKENHLEEEEEEEEELDNDDDIDEYQYQQEQQQQQEEEEVEELENSTSSSSLSSIHEEPPRPPMKKNVSFDISRTNQDEDEDSVIENQLDEDEDEDEEGDEEEDEEERNVPPSPLVDNEKESPSSPVKTTIQIQQEPEKQEDEVATVEVVNTNGTTTTTIEEPTATLEESITPETTPEEPTTTTVENVTPGNVEIETTTQPPPVEQEAKIEEPTTTTPTGTLTEIPESTPEEPTTTKEEIITPGNVEISTQNNNDVVLDSQSQPQPQPEQVQVQVQEKEIEQEPKQEPQPILVTPTTTKEENIILNNPQVTTVSTESTTTTTTTTSSIKEEDEKVEINSEPTVPTTPTKSNNNNNYSSPHTKVEIEPTSIITPTKKSTTTPPLTSSPQTTSQRQQQQQQSETDPLISPRRIQRRCCSCWVM